MSDRRVSRSLLRPAWHAAASFEMRLTDPKSTMTLTSSSTMAAVTAAYEDNADYDLAGSVEKAKAFIQACRILLRRMVEESQNGDRRVRDDRRKISEELAKAEAWWRSNDTAAGAATAAGGGVRHFGFNGMRG